MFVQSTSRFMGKVRAHRTFSAFGAQSIQDFDSDLRDKIRAAAKKSPARLVFLGPPGVGKGTYAGRIAKFLGLSHLSSGDLIRAAVQQGTPEAKEMNATISQGKLLPDELITKLVGNKLRSIKEAGGGYILDGFPRTANQAMTLSKYDTVHAAIDLQMRDDALVMKLLARRKCTHCGKDYNLADVNFPEAPGKPATVMVPLLPPPECAGHLETRSDDTEEVITNRFRIYHKETQPILDFYNATNLLHPFPITRGIPETLPSLMRKCLSVL
jgi:adenylate kinase